MHESISRTKDVKVTKKDVQEFIEFVNNRLDKKEGQELRAIFQDLNLRVEVHPDRLKIESAPKTVGGVSICTNAEGGT